MNAKTKKFTALGLVVFSLAFILHGFSMQVKAQPGTTLNYDVACDCRTFAFNRGIDFTEILAGDTFSVRGKMFPANTLPTGMGTNDPNDPGSVGRWFCLGTAARSFAEIIGGEPQPHFFYNQYFLLDNGSSLTSSGPTGDGDIVAAITGGTGALSGANGDLTATEVGTNVTGCPNIRFSFRLKKQAPK